jgi:hypothetical protein
VARPTGGYYNAENKRIPGVTTILGAWCPGKEGLLVWANRLGLEGKDHREVRDVAASIGTLVHDMVEEHAHGKSPKDVRSKWSSLKPDVFGKADQGFQAYLDWVAQTKLEIVETETPLVSESLQYGGTPDALGYVNGKLALLDWKSSASIREDMLMQLAAYWKLWEECRPGSKVESFHLLRFGKEFGDFHHHSWPVEVMERAWAAFVHLRNVYEISKMLKKAAA